MVELGVFCGNIFCFHKILAALWGAFNYFALYSVATGQKRCFQASTNSILGGYLSVEIVVIMHTPRTCDSFGKDIGLLVLFWPAISEFQHLGSDI